MQRRKTVSSRPAEVVQQDIRDHMDILKFEIDLDRCLAITEHLLKEGEAALKYRPTLDEVEIGVLDVFDIQDFLHAKAKANVKLDTGKSAEVDPEVEKLESMKPIDAPNK